MKNVKRIISLVLMLALVMSLCVIPAMAEDAPKKYAFYGDSMTYNFVNRNNYHNPLYTFAKQTADAMGYSYELIQTAPLQSHEWGALPGGRFTDLYAFLSDYEGDDYFKREFGGWSQERIDGYMRIANEADVLSLQMGYSGVTMVLLQNIISILDNGEQAYSVDISQLFTGDELEKIMPFVSRANKLAGYLFPERTRQALREFANSLSEEQQEALNKVFGAETVSSLNGTIDTLSKISDNFVYLLAAHMIHFDRTVETLLEINPDLELYIMGLTKPVKQIQLSFTLGDEEFFIPIGDMLNVFFDIANLYMKVLSPNSTRYYFVDNVSHAHTYGEAMAEDINVSRDILYTVYNGSWTGHENTESEAYKKADAHAYGVMKALSNTQNINLNKIIEELPDDLDSISLNADLSCLDKLVDVDENGELTATYMEQLMATVYFFTALKGLFVHPDQAGHDVQAPLLIAAMRNPTVAPEAIAYHELVKPMEEAAAELNNCTSVGELVEWSKSIPARIAQEKINVKQAAPVIVSEGTKYAVDTATQIIKATVIKSVKALTGILKLIK